MKYRTTFSLDAEAIRRLKNLAAYWRVSQAEVVRRALEKAEQEMKREAAESYLNEVFEDRKHWRES